jgi:3-deoxy-manno-octulosonate cytidylyltransferase (CMP-KDO synthetase)
MSTAIGVIPARLASTRLPRKLLLDDTGRTVLQHTWENVRQAASLADVVIAADSLEIAEAARRFGATCFLTGEHPSGTDRIAEVARRHLREFELFVNIQGDESELDPDHIDRLVSAISDPNVEMATLGTPIRQRDELESPSCVKIALGDDGRAVYFSRAPIPFVRDADVDELLGGETPWLLHLGIYAYRRDFLLRLTELPPSRLEKLEKLEQLRALEAGATIQVAVVEHRCVGIDTPEDYAKFVARHRRAA